MPVASGSFRAAVAVFRVRQHAKASGNRARTLVWHVGLGGLDLDCEASSAKSSVLDSSATAPAT